MGPIKSLAALCLMAVGGCDKLADAPTDGAAREDVTQAATIGVANSFLDAVVRELVGEDIPFISLAEPGMCPGHFDLRPSQVRAAQRCRLLFRFDFQKSLDARLSSAGDRSPHVAVVQVTGGLCEPQSFVEAGRQVAEALVGEGLLTRAEADERLAAAAQRMADLSTWARQQIAAGGLEDVPVMTSRHQEAFCRSLGLRVVATFPAADISVPSEINDAVQEGQKSAIQYIIANLPEGRQAADALADRLAAQVVVLGNFPDGQGSDSFDRLVRDNVTSLVKAAQP
jgi:zinc transport system substrate-binding protein